jgi:DNA mismatch endonuclease (patch repair protein)
MCKMPQTRTEFWQAKLAANRARDLNAEGELRERGWRIGIVWECALKGRARRPVEDVLNDLAAFASSDDARLEIDGEWVEGNVTEK